MYFMLLYAWNDNRQMKLVFLDFIPSKRDMDKHYHISVPLYSTTVRSAKLHSRSSQVCQASQSDQSGLLSFTARPARSAKQRHGSVTRQLGLLSPLVGSARSTKLHVRISQVRRASLPDQLGLQSFTPGSARSVNTHSRINRLI